MRTSMKIYPEMRKKSKKDNLIPFYLRIIHNGIKSEGRLNPNTAVSEKSLKYWHQPTQQFSKEIGEWNNDIAEIKEAFREITRNKSKCRSLSAKQIKDYLMEDTPTINRTLIQEVELYYENNIYGQKEYARGTIKNKRKAINHLRAYLIASGMDSVSLDDFGKQQVQWFIAYLLQGDSKTNFKGMKRVSAAAIHKELKTVFNGLVDMNIMDRSPFNKTGVKFKKTIQPMLTETEFKNVLVLDFSDSPKLSVYKDIFLFLCYTGLSYIDLLNLKPRDVDGDKLSINRNKSLIYTRQHLSANAVDIVKRYVDSYESKINDSVLPKKSLDKMNLNLKLIGAKAGLSCELSTKYARRFFRQSLYNSNINERLLVRAMMGHSIASEIDGHYLHVTERMLEEAKVKLESYFNLLNSKNGL
jgi:integrase